MNSFVALPNEIVIFTSGVTGVVLAVPSSVENKGNFMLEARKMKGLVSLARTFGRSTILQLDDCQL